MQANLRLYVDAQFASPYAMSAYVALREKGLPFEVSPVDLGTQEQHAASFASLSLTRRVPTLWHDGFALSESSAITEYIDDVFPGARLYPTEARCRARVRQIQAWLRSDLMPLRQERPTEVVFYGRKMPPLSTTGQAAADKLLTAALTLLPNGALYLCDAWSLADTDLALMLNRLVCNGDAVPERLRHYTAAQWQCQSVQEWVQQDRPPLEDASFDDNLRLLTANQPHCATTVAL